MELSMHTSYLEDTGDAKIYLRKIAESGFRHIQWMHHWAHDFIYTEPEIKHIAKLMKDFHLSLYDIHGTTGVEKNWFSTIEYQRLAGVELVRNRIEMCKTLGGSVVVMHIPRMIPENHDNWNQLKKSLNELEKFCVERGVRIAVENIEFEDFAGIKKLFSEYGPEYIGLCYDTGHGNMGGMGLKHLDSTKERLISLHVHDNNGFEDQHKPIFMGTVDWTRFSRILADSPYAEFLTFESEIRLSGKQDEKTFLDQTHEDGLKLLEIIEHERKALATSFTK